MILLRLLPFLFLGFTLFGAPVETADAIREHRTSEVRVVLRDLEGNPVPGVQVRFKQTAHAFMLGCALSANFFDPSASSHGFDRNNYLERFPKLFNTVVFENYMKWENFEHAHRRSTADAMLEWTRGEGLRLRGHTMVWQTFKYGVPLPKDVELAAKAGDREHVARRTAEHIRRIGEQYRGQIEEWDVVNEQVTQNRLTEMLTAPTEDSPSETEVLADWFRIAAEADPNARLFINEFHILVGDHTEHKDRYEAIIERLLEAGAPLQGIGFQGHYHKGYHRRTPEQLKETLDRFARFELPLLVTEFDMYGRDWGDTPEARERNQAEFMETMLTTLFAHPSVSGILFWGFWDGLHHKQEAPFFRMDWSAKPTLDVYRDFFFKRWWTDERAATDDTGVATVRAVHGNYELEITQSDGSVTTVPARFSPEVRSAEIIIPVSP